MAKTQTDTLQLTHFEQVDLSLINPNDIFGATLLDDKNKTIKILNDQLTSSKPLVSIYDEICNNRSNYKVYPGMYELLPAMIVSGQDYGYMRLTHTFKKISDSKYICNGVMSKCQDVVIGILHDKRIKNIMITKKYEDTDDIIDNYSNFEILNFETIEGDMIDIIKLSENGYNIRALPYQQSSVIIDMEDYNEPTLDLLVVGALVNYNTQLYTRSYNMHDINCKNRTFLRYNGGALKEIFDENTKKSPGFQKLIDDGIAEITRRIKNDS